ncbi:MAG TPA: MmcQ/YjbR family DNA-binding protein [Fimbriimonadaceae bacterium]|nr:MmcQ/YjbR family DNA-binding protein [Fimbriimonadaceae bacterium]
MHPLDPDFEIVRMVWRDRNWPGVFEELSWGTPALKVKGKLLVRIREPDVVVLMSDMDAKEFLMMAQPDVYFQTDHYKGYPAVLARLSKIDPIELGERIEEAWRRIAPRKLIAEHDGRPK